MLKIIIALTTLLCYANAGFLEAPLAYHAPVVAAPFAIKAAVPVATSYQNVFKISAAPVPVVLKAAPVVAAPVYKAAPLYAAHAPAIVKSPLVAAPWPYYH